MAAFNNLHVTSLLRSTYGYVKWSVTEPTGTTRFLSGLCHRLDSGIAIWVDIYKGFWACRRFSGNVKNSNLEVGLEVLCLLWHQLNFISLFWPISTSKTKFEAGNVNDSSHDNHNNSGPSSAHLKINIQYYNVEKAKLTRMAILLSLVDDYMLIDDNRLLDEVLEGEER